MADTLALEWLFDTVVQRFAAEGPANVRQLFGWRFVAQHHTGARIVWVPGDSVGGVGRFGPARDPGGDPRSLGTLHETYHVVISANDPTQPENERLQYRATRLLFDAWFRAVHLAAHGVYAIDRPEWIVERLERRFGAALRVTGSIQAKIPDSAPTGPDYDYAPIGTDAAIDLTELDVTEPLSIEGTA